MSIERIFIEKSSQDPVELGERFGFWGMEIPFVFATEVKDLPSNDWLDEDGADEFLPASGLTFKPFDLKIKLGYKGAINTAHTHLAELLNYLTGRDGSGAGMRLYSTYTKQTFGGVRFVSIGDDAELVRDSGGDILVIEVTFRVNSPADTGTVTVPLLCEDVSGAVLCESGAAINVG